ncbi:hypothetical protein [Maribacter antarcticus]|uniref:hypothetical protein n=1 Tax=Maribacter antarcticus TaxID=505250 RepID=UPI00047B84A6|nr:hypothetical protein [Maribacter antarcticus]
MKKYLFAFLGISSLYLTAQNKTNTDQKNQFEFLTGYTSGFLKNLPFAPVSRYSYTGLNYQLKYSRTTKREKLFEIQLDYLNSELTSDVIPMLNVDSYSKVVLNISALKRVLYHDKLTIHLGLQAQTNVSSYFQWDLYDFQQKLGVAVRFRYQVAKKQSLSSKLTLPFIMWRTSTFEENFYSLKRYQSLLWTAAYTYALSNQFDVIARYNFNYDRIQISNAYRELQHQINLGVTFKF